MQNTIFTIQIVKFNFYTIIVKKEGWEVNPAFFSFPGAGNGSGLLYIADPMVSLWWPDVRYLCSSGIAFAVMDEG